MLLGTRNKCARVEWVLNQHKCCRERAKFELLVTQKFLKKKKEEAGLQPAGGATSQAGKTGRRRANPALRRVGWAYFIYIYIYNFLFFLFLIFFYLSFCG